LHPAQEDEEHPPQPDPPPEPSDDLPMPNRERRFSVSFDPHFGQSAAGSVPKTSFSKHSVQAQH